MVIRRVGFALKSEPFVRDDHRCDDTCHSPITAEAECEVISTMFGFIEHLSVLHTLTAKGGRSAAVVFKTASR